MTAPLTPLSLPDHADPGDETQARFRYQHAYGAMLALGSLRSSSSTLYTAIHCEQLEDLLAETVEGTFDAYQLKTRKPEQGPWRIREESFLGSVRRFVRHHQQFGEQLRTFHFVSNTEPLMVTTSENSRQQASSPGYLLKNCANHNCPADLPASAGKAFKSLLEACESTENELFSVLKRTHFVKGPPFDGYFDELVNRHLAAHSISQHIPISKLQRLARELISLFADASALPGDPDARVMPFDETKQGSTTVRSKRVTIDEVAALIHRRHQGAVHAALDGDLDLAGLSQIGSGRRRLVRKLEAGGLQQPQIRAQQRRLLTAQAWFLEQAAMDPGEAANILQQLVGVVGDLHANAHAEVYAPSSVFGLPLYNAMHKEFQLLIKQSPQKAAHQDTNFLFGVAALLTEDCQLWWSDVFDVEAAQ